MFCVDLRANSDYFPIQHLLTGLYNRDGVCLLRGTDSFFKQKIANCTLRDAVHTLYCQNVTPFH
jgi:hypothetical protein